MDNLKQLLNTSFTEALNKSTIKEIRDVKAGRVKIDVVPVKPPLPSFKKKISVMWKDPEAVSNAVEEYIDSALRKVKNSGMIRDDVAEIVYAGIRKAGIGECIEVEIDLETGEISLVK